MRPKTTLAACLLGLAFALALAACGKEEEPGADEPAREGLAIPLEGLEYNVFITRQLNMKIEPDSAYYKGPPPPKGETLYGVFLQVCNRGSEPRESTDEFTVVDNQGNEFEPAELDEDNDFAYVPRRLPPHECIPPEGSVAQQGPTAGSMLLFKLPFDVTENRPLELEIKTFDPAESRREIRSVELDL